ncbi:hypothetical protein EGW08_021188, partial [Elysia chlorotica]
MGGVCNCLGGNGVSYVAGDTVNSFGDSDVHHLRHCMRKVSGKMEEFGLDVFADMFAMYPYTREWFRNYRTSPGEVYSDLHIKSHAVTVIQTFQLYVDYGNDTEILNMF